jgi:hypothetical protein
MVRQRVSKILEREIVKPKLKRLYLVVDIDKNKMREALRHTSRHLSNGSPREVFVKIRQIVRITHIQIN